MPLFLFLLHLFPSYTSSEGILYSDWDKLMTCHPLTYTLPSTEDQIISHIHSSKYNNETLKIVGAGHSFSGIQLTDGNMISLDRYNRILKTTYMSTGEALVEVQAGIRLRDLNDQLEAMNLAIENLGATAAQSLAGAISTGTHGTGAALGSISTQIKSMRVIDSDGMIHIASDEDDAELLAAARAGLGAVGVISTLTLRTVPLFRMRKTQVSYDLSALLQDLPDLLNTYDRLQWWFTPYTSDATLLTREVTTDSISPAAGGQAGCWSSLPTAASECVDVSYKTMVDSIDHYEDRDLYTEMEMFIPVEYTQAAVLDFIAFQESVKDKHDPDVELFTGVRYVAADDILLSPLYRRNSSVISFIVIGDKDKTGSTQEFEMYSRGLEAICEEKYEGRAHWGKVNYMNADIVRTSYGKNYDRFMEVKKRMDPNNMFTNDYLMERLGL
eukprot:CAMPEP_0185021352 /NCGR_PEP_ID=MMETSP1103-20130426/4039_1 /TAXON_ID=36769 /ORGANISM="Paraphysomonas bandaiensis, Strain Caron Lab Isolate" /LENGTH=441 /DNA_ID=CAMNT_0027552829 /DNA_START=32 /DNA_END=1357 /DNA_ORIENTATION=-